MIQRNDIAASFHCGVFQYTPYNVFSMHMYMYATLSDSIACRTPAATHPFSPDLSILVITPLRVGLKGYMMVFGLGACFSDLTLNLVIPYFCIRVEGL